MDRLQEAIEADRRAFEANMAVHARLRVVLDQIQATLTAIQTNPVKRRLSCGGNASGSANKSLVYDKAS